MNAFNVKNRIEFIVVCMNNYVFDGQQLHKHSKTLSQNDPESWGHNREFGANARCIIVSLKVKLNQSF